MEKAGGPRRNAARPRVLATSKIRKRTPPIRATEVPSSFEIVGTIEHPEPAVLHHGGKTDPRLTLALIDKPTPAVSSAEAARILEVPEALLEAIIAKVEGSKPTGSIGALDWQGVDLEGFHMQVRNFAQIAIALHKSGGDHVRASAIIDQVRVHFAEVWSSDPWISKDLLSRLAVHRWCGEPGCEDRSSVSVGSSTHAARARCTSPVL